jgi:GR25 family glycosyltransferase involved in LPS biosynthesis
MDRAIDIPAFILYSLKEENRKLQVDALKKTIPTLQLVEAIFPKYEKVAFLQKLISVSKKRTGRALMPAEIGVLLGHRKIWRKIIQSTIDQEQHVLILESDSKIAKPDLLEYGFNSFTKNYDIFFWGAWDGHTRLKKSSIIYNQDGQAIGEPLIKSVYCTYGYSLNKRAAAYLLKATGRINFPVDMYKKHIHQGDLKLGAARPEIISAWYNTPSSIQKQNWMEKIKRFCIVQIFDFRNSIQAYFS